MLLISASLERGCINETDMEFMLKLAKSLIYFVEFEQGY